MKEALLSAMQKAVQSVRQWPSKKIELYHHNDTDGLTSGTILTTAFNRSGYSVHRYALEKPYPLVLEHIFKKEGYIIVFADFAGKIAPTLSQLNNHKNLVLILDHHAAEQSKDEFVHNLDGDLYGIKGDRDISASTTCYLFATLLSSENKDLAHLAVLGAVGDGFFQKGRLVDINYDAVQEAKSQKLLTIREHTNGEDYYIYINNQEYACRELVKELDVLGGVGYYQGGPELGVRICSEGLFSQAVTKITSYAALKEALFTREIENIRKKGFNQTPHIQWIDIKELFFPMGVKMIGQFCNTIKNMDICNPQKYLAGFQHVPEEIPGIGRFAMNQTKVSMRVSSVMEEQIRSGRKPGLHTFLVTATKRLGGFVDACHSLAAATTVPIGQEEQLIREMEHVLYKVYFGKS
jgi:single-stranded-DNA-specific exonuclease